MADPVQPTPHAADSLSSSREENCTAPNWPMEECPVCFEPVGGDCPVRRLSCGHGFHHSCIAKWLQRKSLCPICKADAAADASEVQPQPVFRIDLGHQEMSRVLQELESIFHAVHGAAGPNRSVPVSGLVMNLCESLGYEDEDELEEALGGPLVDFLSALPHFDVTWEAATASSADSEVNTTAEGGANEVARDPKVRMRPDDVPASPEHEGVGGKRITFTVSEKEDLWRVLLQGSSAIVEIPELEFAIRPDRRRRIDTIYNMIAAAVFDLSNHVRNVSSTGNLHPDEIEKICDAIRDLNALLDLDQPFTIVVSDSEGVSSLKPTDGIHIEPYAEPAEA